MSRFAWCESPTRAVNVHAACRRTYTSNGRTHVCECPCHADSSADKKVRNNPCSQGESIPSSGKMGQAAEVRQHHDGSNPRHNSTRPRSEG